MYKIRMLDDKGEEQLWKCGSNCAIARVSPFFQEKSYLLVPDSYKEMYRQHNPNQCEAIHSVPGFNNMDDLEDIGSKTVSEVKSIMSANLIYLGTLAAERYFPAEIPNDFLSETIYNISGMVRAAFQLERQSNRTEDAMEKIGSSIMAKKISKDVMLSMHLFHAAICQCGKEWEDFETYCGFWHSMFSVWSGVEGGCFKIEHLEDTDELETENPLAIPSPLLSHLKDNGNVADIIPELFEISVDELKSF